MDTYTLKSPQEQIGRILRTFREKTGRNIAAVASGAHISTSMLSQIERGVVAPSIDTLFLVCQTLGLDIADLFNRLSQRTPIRINHVGQRLTTQGDGARYEQLVSSIDNSHPAEMFLLELPPKHQVGLSGKGHEGVEMGYVLAGSAVLTVDNESHRIHKGDSISFMSQLPHSLINDGAGAFRAVWTVLPPHKDFLGSEESIISGSDETREEIKEQKSES